MSESMMKQVTTTEGELFWIKVKGKRKKTWKWYGDVYNSAGVILYLRNAGVNPSQVPLVSDGVYEYKGQYNQRIRVQCLKVNRAVNLNADEEAFRQQLIARATEYAQSCMDSQRKEDAYMESEEYVEDDEAW